AAWSTLPATRCPIRSFNLSGLSMLKTLWLNSLTNTTCSPSPRHFFPHCSWPTPAPLAPHFESLTQPFSHLSLGALDFAGASTANDATRNNTQPTEDSFFISVLLTSTNSQANTPSPI